MNDDNYSFRFDAEYFKKEYIEAYNKLMRNSKHISNLAKVTDGEHGSPDLDINSNIVYLSSHNVKDNIIDLSDIRYCTKELDERNSRSRIEKGNVLLSIVGTVGNSSVVYKSFTGNTDRNVATIKEINGVNPYLVSTLLNSHYGKLQTERLQTGNVQPLLNLLQVKQLLIPIFSDTFQQKIEQCVKSAHAKLEQSKVLYTQAEELLLEELNLKDFEPSNVACFGSAQQAGHSPSNRSLNDTTRSLSVVEMKPGIAIKNLSESFGSSDRLDAEYYQPKYEEIEKRVKDYSGGWDTVGNIVHVDKSIEPGSAHYESEGIPFVRVADITKYGIDKTDKYLSRIEFNNAIKPGKDTILLTKDGTLGIAYTVKGNMDVITSGAILHLKIRDEINILPEYLSLVINSIAVQMQAERDTGGSIIQHWRPGQIKKIIIPLLPLPIQKQMAQMIEKSFTLRKESEQLLENAKRAVELAIEQGEDKAVEQGFL